MGTPINHSKEIQMSAPKRKANTIKVKGRKFVVVNTTVARKDHKNVTVQLVKRAGKVHWFTLEGGVLTRYKGFWEALQAYSARQDELGVKGHEVTAVVGTKDGPVLTDGELSAIELLAAQGKANA